MINYELALQLKNAGFPQKDIRWYEDGRIFDEASCSNPRNEQGTYEIEINKVVYKPSLEEFIEACEDNLINIHNYNGSFYDKWVCNMRTEDGREGLVICWDSSGSTPLEAVANLFLALNSK